MSEKIFDTLLPFLQQEITKLRQLQQEADETGSILQKLIALEESSDGTTIKPIRFLFSSMRDNKTSLLDNRGPYQNKLKLLIHAMGLPEDPVIANESWFQELTHILNMDSDIEG